MAVRRELVYGPVIPAAGQGEIKNLGVFTGKMEVNETDAQGRVIGRKTVARVTLVGTDEGVFVVPGDIGSAAGIPWHEVKSILPKDIVKQMQNALRREKRQRRSLKTRG